jgi:hypothetical protein
MKMTISIFLLLFLVVITFDSAIGQNPQFNSEVYPEKVNLFDEKDYAGWQKIELKNLLFYAPKELKSQKVMCYDSDCYRFQSDDLILDLSFDVESRGSTTEKSYPNYSENLLLINDNVALSWFFERKMGEFNSFAGIRFIYEKTNNQFVRITSNKKALTMKLFFKEFNNQEMAKKIFRSIKFKNELKKK